MHFRTCTRGYSCVDWIRRVLKGSELPDDILSHFFDSLNCGSSAAFGKEEKHQRVDSRG